MDKVKPLAIIFLTITLPMTLLGAIIGYGEALINDHLRLRVTRQYDLGRQEGGGYLWRKTIVDGRCFRRMEATVYFDNAYRVIEKQIEGGRFVDRDAWNLNR